LDTWLSSAAGYFPLQPSVCVVWATMDVLLCTASIWHMCTMSLDRYCTLRYPISYGRSRTRTSVGVKIAFVWVVSAAVCAAVAVSGFADYSSVFVEGQCIPTVKDFVLYGSIFAFYVPLVIMVVTYVLTVQILAENRRTMASIGLHSTVGVSGDKVAGGNGVWMTGKWDGPVAARICNVVRKTDGPPTGRYHRKLMASWGLASRRPTTDSKLNQIATKSPATPRNQVEEQSNISSSINIDRHSTDMELSSMFRGGIKNTSRSCPVGTINRHRSLSQPSTANLSSQSIMSPALNPAAGLNVKEGNDQDEVLPSSLTGSEPSDCLERRQQNRVCRQCLESLQLQSDKPDDLASFNETASTSNIPTICNTGDCQRRSSDGLMFDYQKISGRNQRRISDLDRRSLRSFYRPGRQRSFGGELRTSTTSENRRPANRGRNSASFPAANVSICDPHRPRDCILTPVVSDSEALQLACGGVETSGFRPQRHNSRPTPQRREGQQNHVESGAFDTATSIDCDRVARGSITTGTGADSETCNRGDDATTRRNILVDRAVTKWSDWLRRQAATDTSMSMSSGSMSEATNHFQMSTFQRSRNFVNASTSTIHSVGTDTTKYRRKMARKERKASKVLGIIFAVFVMLWTPFFIVNVLSVVCSGCVEALGSDGMSSIVWLGYVSSLANPIVYTMFSTSFRTVFHRILTCQACPRRRAVQSFISYPPSRQATLGDAVMSGRRDNSHLQK